LAASLLDAAKQMLGIAVRSGNLKGTYIEVLREDAIIAAGVTLGKRIYNGDGENHEILEEIREENKRLRTLQEMKKEMERLKE
ncbi:hypothetical protein EAI_07494, partial [Harpegnathos saltator]